jgi:hypothetical protein
MERRTGSGGHFLSEPGFAGLKDLGEPLLCGLWIDQVGYSKKGIIYSGVECAGEVDVYLVNERKGR